QRVFRDRGIPMMLIFEGLGGSGKGRLVNNLLLCWDPRGFTYNYVKLSPEERDRYPMIYHYGTRTPARGRISVFGRCWYREILDRGVGKGQNDRFFKDGLEMADTFERQLASDGTLILKFFIHIDRKEQKKRLKKREKDPSSAWAVTEYDWSQNRDHSKYVNTLEKILQETDSEYAPWMIVEATDLRFATCKILSTVQKAMEERLSKGDESRKANSANLPVGGTMVTSVLDELDLARELDKDRYKAELEKYQDRLHSLELEVFQKGLPVVALFEGIDAAGKGGSIKRLAQCLYPRNYQVVPIGAPKELELQHHYLWRFWKELPARGQIKIFDRSWYGRVLVERVEGFASPEEWKRAFREINELEKHLDSFGAVIVKFWLQIDREEQHDRFMSRKEDPSREWKLTEDDWRNREKWDLYMDAAREMLFRTSTSYAPWTVVEGNSKEYARIKVLKTVCEAIEKGLEKTT
ncbi:MAG: polyphosphate:AMP phosphotransferase, partial [Synergistales bacterium]|nr:polyphosphate:AMP phosphotransferase [Synergistales bacterium]